MIQIQSIKPRLEANYRTQRINKKSELPEFKINNDNYIINKPLNLLDLHKNHLNVINQQFMKSWSNLYQLFENPERPFQVKSNDKQENLITNNSSLNSNLNSKTNQILFLTKNLNTLNYTTHRFNNNTFRSKIFEKFGINEKNIFEIKEENHKSVISSPKRSIRNSSNNINLQNLKKFKNSKYNFNSNSNNHQNINYEYYPYLTNQNDIEKSSNSFNKDDKNDKNDKTNKNKNQLDIPSISDIINKDLKIPSNKNKKENLILMKRHSSLPSPNCIQIQLLHNSDKKNSNPKIIKIEKIDKLDKKSNLFGINLENLDNIKFAKGDTTFLGKYLKEGKCKTNHNEQRNNNPINKNKNLKNFKDLKDLKDLKDGQNNNLINHFKSITTNEKPNFNNPIRRKCEAIQDCLFKCKEKLGIFDKNIYEICKNKFLCKNPKKANSKKPFSRNIFMTQFDYFSGNRQKDLILELESVHNLNLFKPDLLLPHAKSDKMKPINHFLDYCERSNSQVNKDINLFEQSKKCFMSSIEDIKQLMINEEEQRINELKDYFEKMHDFKYAFIYGKEMGHYISKDGSDLISSLKKFASINPKYKFLFQQMIKKINKYEEHVKYSESQRIK